MKTMLFSMENYTQKLFIAFEMAYSFFMDQTRPLFRLFSVFSNKQYNFYNKSMWKMPCSSSIRRWDLNPWPLECESPPITTRPGLPPSIHFLCYWKNWLLYIKLYWTNRVKMLLISETLAITYPETTYRSREKYHCMAELLIDWFAFDQVN